MISRVVGHGNRAMRSLRTYPSTRTASAYTRAGWKASKNADVDENLVRRIGDDPHTGIQVGGKVSRHAYRLLKDVRTLLGRPIPPVSNFYRYTMLGSRGDLRLAGQTVPRVPDRVSEELVQELMERVPSLRRWPLGLIVVRHASPERMSSHIPIPIAGGLVSKLIDLCVRGVLSHRRILHVSIIPPMVLDEKGPEYERPDRNTFLGINLIFSQQYDEEVVKAHDRGVLTSLVKEWLFLEPRGEHFEVLEWIQSALLKPLLDTVSDSTRKADLQSVLDQKFLPIDLSNGLTDEVVHLVTTRLGERQATAVA